MTIEFEKTMSKNRSAVNKIAAAASLALFDRWKMRRAKIEQSGLSHEGPESTLDLDQIKYYGISMLGPIFDI